MAELLSMEPGGLPFMAALAACSACAQQPAAYVTDGSASARTVEALLQAAEAGDSAEAAALVQPAASLIYQADVGTDLNVANLRHYVLPRLEGCGPRKISETLRSNGQSQVSVACSQPRPSGPLEGRDVSFLVRNGKIIGANTNDAMIMESPVDG